MSITRVQQSQISGSLLPDGTLTPGAALEKSVDLAGDLNALRSLVLDIKGDGSWFEAATQDLKQVYDAMHASGADAEMQGNLNVKGNLIISGSTVLGDSSSDTITFSAKAASDLAMDSHKVSGLAQANATGDALGWGQDASVSDLIVTAGDFTVDASGNVIVGGTLGVTGVATFSDAITGSMGLKLSGDADLGSLVVQGTSELKGLATLSNGLTVNSAVADFNAGVTANEIKIDGDAVGHLYVVGATGEIQDEAALRFEAGSLFVSGAAVVDSSLQVKGAMQVTGSANFGGGIVVDAGGMEISGDKLEITGSFGVSGASALDGSLSVSGLATLSNGLSVSGAAADFNAGVTADSIKIDGDTAQRLYIVDSDGSMKDESKLTFDQSKLYVDGNAELTGDLILGGNDIMSKSGAMTFTAITLSGSDVEVVGDLKVSGNDIKSFGGTTAISLSSADVSVKGDLTVEGHTINDYSAGMAVAAIELSGSDVAVEGDLTVKGNTIKGLDGAAVASYLELQSGGDVKVFGDLVVGGNDIKSGGAMPQTVMTLSGQDVLFANNVTVSGDLAVQGAMTYIETENLKVKDALIHLATGSNAAAARGIVLHGNTIGGFGDIALGAKAAGFDFIFAKNVDDSDVDAGNSEIFSAADLAGAWMSSLKLGLAEDALSGSLAVDGSNIKLSAAADLNLESNGNSVGLMESADYSNVFAATKWANGMTIVGALDALYNGASAGGSKKGALGVGDVTGGVLDFSSVGTLITANQANVDVYLNGVLLSYGYDVTAVSSTTATLDAAIAGSLTSADVLTVILRGAA